MAGLFAMAFLLVHLAFLWRVMEDFGMGWALACLIIPPLSLLMLYQGWSRLKGYFFLEVILLVARYSVS